MVVFPRMTKQWNYSRQSNFQQHDNNQRQNNQRQKIQRRPIRPIMRQIGSSVFGIFLALTVATSAFAQSCPLYPSPHQRIGFNVAPDNGVDINNYDAAQLGGGWYHNYGNRAEPYHPGGIQYHQMVRSAINRANLQGLLGPKVRNNPGAVWLIGNEPDSSGQDNMSAAEYATFYHDLYTFLKAEDPTSRIAVGGVSQPTPIRLRYLDMVLSSYEQQYGTPLPADMWHVHNFILPEDCSWGGVSIPPGMEAYRSEAIPCHPSLNEHGDINTFKEQLRTFRTWMQERGYRNMPLIVSEYGILLSKYHGYDHARVRDYMLASFDFMLNTTDSASGYPLDGNRLVQEFAWFSLNFFEFDINTYQGLNGNLFDYESRAIMPLGLDYAAYTQPLTLRTIDLALTDFQASATEIDVEMPLTFTATLVNQGGIAAEDVVLQLWDGDPNHGGNFLQETPITAQMLTGCQNPIKFQQQWRPTTGGAQTIYGLLRAGNDYLEVDDTNNEAAIAITVQGAPPTPTATATLTGPTSTPTPISTLHTPTPTASATATAILTTSPTATATPTARATPSPTTAPLPETTVLVDPQRTTTLAIRTLDGAWIKVTIPAGTFTEPTTIVLRSLNTLPSATRTLAYAGYAFQLEAYRNNEPVTTFQLPTPIQLTLEYMDNGIGQVDEASLMLYVYETTGNDWERSGITLIRHNMTANQLIVSYHDGDRAPDAIRSFAIFAETPATVTPTPTATATATPTATVQNGVTSTPTPPSLNDLVNHQYLPFIQN